MPEAQRVQFTRRAASFTLGFLPALGLSGGSARAADDNTTKGAAWILGDRLSLAALLYNQGAAADMQKRYLSAAQTIAGDLGVTIPPFPARGADKAAATADLLHYLIAGEGAQIGAALTRKFGHAHGDLFEVSVKSNLLILLYAPGDSLGASIARVVRTRMQADAMPSRLWSPLVEAVMRKRPVDEVKNAVFKMHKDVAEFFIPGAG